MDIEEQAICDECAIDEMMLESFGVEITESMRSRINESLARSDSEKLFGIDGFLVFNAEDAAEYVEGGDAFSDYLENDFYPCVDSCSALVLIEQWSETFVRERLVSALNKLDKGEVFRFDDFFRGLIELEDEVDMSAVKLPNLGKIGKMPRIVRIF